MHYSKRIFNINFYMCRFCKSKATKTIIKTPGWSIISCCNCGNAWTLPFPIKIYYEKKDFHSKDKTININDLPKQWKKSIYAQIKLLSRYLKPNANILEIGCGQGIFLNELKKLGFNVVGIEPSKTAVKKARENGLNVINDYFPNKEISHKKFDAVIMIHVLEHINNTDMILREIQKIITPGGFLMLVQTNWKGLMPRIYKSNWYAWVPRDHYWHFTPKGLKIYCKKFNFKIIKIEYSSLVHKKNIISFLSNLIPKTKDQFHILLKHLN